MRWKKSSRNSQLLASLKEQKELEAFYESVKLRASGIDNARAKQQIIVTLYDKFFRTGFKETTERLGGCLHSCGSGGLLSFIQLMMCLENILIKPSPVKVHILDPFTGTGTFITRTLHYLKSMMDRGEIQLENVTWKICE